MSEIGWEKQETPYLKEGLVCDEHHGSQWESHQSCESFFITRITEGRKVRIMARCTQCDREYLLEDE